MSTQTLQQLLRESAQALAQRRPSPEQDAAVLRQLTRQLRAQPEAQFVGGGTLAAPLRWLAGSGALLTLLALLFALSLLRLEPVKPAPISSGYLPLVSPEEWSQARADGDTVWIVPTEMPRERLALLGLPYDPARAGDNVRAEVMVHRSGQVLAVRFVQ
ncbi:hypothetical protein [Inhella proteolytica]|uniref:Uncharacterized protein n=1 Tax=Inhella proteolytica TaxID=2795029 RepID=A0A931NI85_9BURK|nr:hypothetical protein [Inhella proteolytica]MBH9577310.1 hypothetical protein [Inhella proteolytica]